MENWMNSPYVDCWVDYEEVEEIDINEKLISWFDIKFNLPETDEEKEEKRQAIREQIQAGVLLPNGIPPGVQMPPQQLKSVSNGTKILTQQQKKHLKNMRKREERKKNKMRFSQPTQQIQEVKNGFKLSPLALKIQQQMTRGKRHDE